IAPPKESRPRMPCLDACVLVSLSLALLAAAVAAQQSEPSPPHGNRQILTFRVTTQNHRHATETLPAVTAEELSQCGAHYCEVIYPGEPPPMWRFQR
ncbi:MAG: hypothetical protein ACE5JM_15010, partial [Armatimonadota bacterium]